MIELVIGKQEKVIKLKTYEPIDPYVSVGSKSVILMYDVYHLDLNIIMENLQKSLGNGVVCYQGKKSFIDGNVQECWTINGPVKILKYE